MSILKTCAFAGHRPSLYRFGFDEEHTDCLKIKLLMAQHIAELISSGVSSFLSGMALGADIWGAEQRERYFNILAACDDTVYISRHYTPYCMFQRNRYLAENADVLLAVYNGCKKGSTAYTVKYAKSMGKEVRIIDPEAV